MGIEVAAGKPHVVFIPFPAQGHINPALAFAQCLASKGLLVTLITTTTVAKSARFSGDCSSVTVDCISDGWELVKERESIDGYFKRFRSALSLNLAKYIDEHSHSSRFRAIIYDSIMPWVQDIAKERGLVAGSFFTQTCAFSAVVYHLKQGLVTYPYEDYTASLTLPALPALENKDLPSFRHLVKDSDQIVVKLLTDQFLNLETVDWIFFNTFDKLESQVIEWMRSRWPMMKTVGPTFLLGRGGGGGGGGGGGDKSPSSNNHSISLFESQKHDACIEWLDSRETSSVVYVSFGSTASLNREQMEELAFGLISSNLYFLWIVRSSEVDKLPQDFTAEKGLIIDWCHQPQVLAHRAVACFMTHCGWNSTLEALSNGVPLIAMPQWVDQNTNAKFVEDVWGVGIGVERGENEIVGRKEIATCVKRVVEGDEGIELKRNACRWKELACEAVQNGGTSANNIDDFVSKLIFAERL